MTTSLRIGDTVRLKGDPLEGHDRIGKVSGLGAGYVSVTGQFTHGEPQTFPFGVLERVDVVSLAEEIEAGVAERPVRIATGSHVEDGKVVVPVTLTYLRNQPVAIGRLTPHEALNLAQSLINSASQALGVVQQ